MKQHFQQDFQVLTTSSKKNSRLGGAGLVKMVEDHYNREDPCIFYSSQSHGPVKHATIVANNQYLQPGEHGCCAQEVYTVKTKIKGIEPLLSRHLRSYVKSFLNMKHISVQTTLCRETSDPAAVASFRGIVFRMFKFVIILALCKNLAFVVNGAETSLGDLMVDAESGQVMNGGEHDIVSWDSVASSKEEKDSLPVLMKSEVKRRMAEEKVGKSNISSKKRKTSHCQICEKPDDLCVSYKGSKTKCRRGRDFSSRCYNDSMCYSGSCHDLFKKCFCPTPGSCNGCNNPNVPCLRVEHQASQPLEICGLSAIIKKSGKEKKYNAELFDFGAAHSNTYKNLEKISESSSRGHCLSVVSFLNGTAAKLPPAFVQSSVLTEHSRNISQIEVRGIRSSMLGLQIFIDDIWITYISKADLHVPSKKSGKSLESFFPEALPDERLLKKGKYKSIATIKKAVYPRLNLDSIDVLRNTSFVNSLAGVTLVVPISPGRELLNFDIPAQIGVEFIGKGSTQSELSIIGDIHSYGRTNFKYLKVSFDLGSLNIHGPVIFQSSQIVNIHRCPLMFSEFNGMCFMVSDGIEQADDARAFCTSVNGTLALETDAKLFIQNNVQALSRNSLAWVNSTSSAYLCSRIDAVGDIERFADASECDEFLQIICSTNLRNPIVGEKYTSYNSDHFIGTYSQDYYRRAVDRERIPYHFGGTLTFVQSDHITYGDDGEEIPSIFRAPEGFPWAISVKVNMHSGNSSSILVALDTFNTTGQHGHKWLLDENATSLPTKIQLHTTEDATCVRSVDILVHNETGHQFVVASVPTNIFAECLDYNVCSEQNELLCRRSLMFYDVKNNCARLDTGSSIVPRDLSIDLLSLGCSRLISWHHHNLGEPFFIEAEFDAISHPFAVKEYLGSRHQYLFDESTRKLEMDVSNALPSNFLLSGGNGLLRSFAIKRYGLVIAGANFADFWDCINVCEAIANPLGLDYGPQLVQQSVLDLLAPNECQKLVEVFADAGTGREVCTSHPIMVASLEDIRKELALMADSSSKFKTLSVNVTGNFDDQQFIHVITNRGLRLFYDMESDNEGGGFERAIFSVANLAELFVTDLTFNGTATIITDRLARVEMSGVDISINSGGSPFLMNEGQTILESCRLYSYTILDNISSGQLQLFYVSFYDSSSFYNSNDGVIQISRLSIYEEFISMDSSELKGTYQLLDAKRLYKTLDDEDDELCQGHDVPDLSIRDVTTQECHQLCENQFVCTGTITHFNDGIPSCGLCLQEKMCAFSCSSYSGGAYYKAESKFDFVKVSACPYISRPFKALRDVTLEECKLYCSYYRSCEGFQITSENEYSAYKSCELIADLDFAESCSINEAVEIYIPYFPGSIGGFYNISGKLVALIPIAEHKGVSSDQCAVICEKTISCVSFQHLNGNCHLYNDKSYIRSSSNDGFFISVKDPFPLKRYMAYQSCYIPGSYASLNTKTIDRCKSICNEDYSCVGFSFRPLRSLFEDNCNLYDSSAMVNGIFGPELGCQRQPLRRDGIDNGNGGYEITDTDITDQNDLNETLPVKHPDLFRSLRKKAKSQEPSSTPFASPSNEPSKSPTTKAMLSIHPSSDPFHEPTTEPSHKPSLSMEPSFQPTSDPSLFPSKSMIPSQQPSLTVRPSQVSETYDLYVAFSTDNFTPSSEHKFESVQNITGVIEDECQALCFYDTSCVAIQYNASLNLCQIGSLSRGTSDKPYRSIESTPVDEASRYLVSYTCYVGERLHDHENEVIVTEITSGYHHMPGLCSSSSISDNSTLYDVSPAECSLLCSNDSSCVGFTHYVDYGGNLNRGNLGKCKKESSFDFGSCNAVDENSDFYLRADLGATCQTQCNVHQLCSSFIVNDGECKLFSDISLVHTCESNQRPERVNIGLSYRSRDGMVAVPGQCFVEYEDLKPLGCREIPLSLTEDMSYVEIDSMTPLKCQQLCKTKGKEFYAVHRTNRCYCTSENVFSLSSLHHCNATCPGDSSQSCGGIDVANVGETNLPLFGLTLAECKRECFFSGSCEAIQFNDDFGNTKCELRSVGKFENCEEHHAIFIENLEHYYERPRTSYIGSKSLHNATVELRQDCQKLCDAFHGCEAINYTDVLSVLNCEILGGEMVPLEEEEVAEGVQVAKDVTLYTLGFAPNRNEELAVFSTTFDLDECMTLCDQHVLCGSIEFSSPDCRLFAKSAFADVSTAPTNHYIDYSYFVDPSREFALAKGLCLANKDGLSSLKSRETVLSSYDCAKHCNSMNSCSVFTYDKENYSCKLYDEHVALTFSDCDLDIDTYTMFTRSKFVEKPHACLKNEDELHSFQFELKTPYECAALCDKWFNCRSFRSHDSRGLCQLFGSEQFSIDSCNKSSTQVSVEGKLYVYYSDYRFTRLGNNFCVGSNALAVIDDLPIEACKSICDKSLDCLSFQHTQVGLCALYASADFSGKCSVDDNRDLYISYKDVVDPEYRFVFNDLDSCFDTTDIVPYRENEDGCKELCRSSENCFGLQVKNNILTNEFECALLDQGRLLPSVHCDSQSKAFLKTKLNPYKLLQNTCLQNRIPFGTDRDAVIAGVIKTKEDYNVTILDKEDYECMALCNVHPSCRYFLYGNNTSVVIPQLRECILFEAQPIEVDDCKNERADDKFIYDYNKLPAYVNGRTFIDQITWFGEPEINFANITDITYQECASLCDALEDCSAFIHTWNYRRAPFGSGRSLLFTNTRLTSLDFKRDGNHKALFLMFDIEKSQLVLRNSDSDDDVKKQLISPEILGDGSFKLKFWSSSGKCLSAKGPFVHLTDAFNRHIISENFDGSQAACQKIDVADCDEDTVIQFAEGFSQARLGQEITFAYRNLNGRGSGCIGIHRSSFEQDVDITGKTEELLIPPLLLDQNVVESVETTWCLQIDGSQCEVNRSYEFSCSNSTSDMHEKKYDVIESCSGKEESCVVIDPTQAPTVFSSLSAEPGEGETPVPSEPMPSPTTVLNCTYNTITRITTRSFLQKTTEDVLKEMYVSFSELCGASNNDGDVELFSSTYSGNGCDFKQDVAEFPSQQFTWASDGMIVQNNNYGSCLSEDLHLIQCDSETTVKWVYLFTTGHLYFVDDSNSMVCLTRLSDGVSVILETCDKDDMNQSWEYNPDIESLVVMNVLVEEGAKQCLSASSSGRAIVENCSASAAKWSAFEECRLNSRKRSAGMVLESVKNPGMCIDIHSSNNAVLTDDCVHAAKWNYYYSGNEARLELVDETNTEKLCLGRRADEYEITEDESNIGLDELKMLPTGLVPCSTDKVVYWRNTIAGEEHNIFRWSLVDRTTGTAVGPQFCLDVPQEAQVECPSDIEEARTWRKLGSAGDATEISVKPMATLQDINDPEVLFQFYLFGAEGKTSRVVRSRMAALVRDVELLKKMITGVLGITTEALNLVESVQTPLREADDRFKDGAESFKAFNLILTPLEKIPKIGPIFKGLNVPVKAVEKEMKLGNRLTGTTAKKVEKVPITLETFQLVVEKVETTLPIVFSLEAFVDFITRSSFCAYREDNMEYYELTQKFIAILASKITISMSLIEDIKIPLQLLNTFKAKMNNHLVKPINGFKATLHDIFSVIEKLSFLKELANFKIPVPYPKVKIKAKCKWYGCWPHIDISFDKKKFGLEEIGDFIDTVIGVIKKIPGVGWVVRKVEDAIEGTIKSLFGNIAIPIPKFEIDLVFLDELQKLVQEAKQQLDSFIHFFTSIMDMDGSIDELIGPIFDTFEEMIPSLDLDFFNCTQFNTTDECFFSRLVNFIQVENEDSLIPDISIGDVDISLPDGISDVIQSLTSDFESVAEAIMTVFDEIKCERYETLPVNIREFIDDNFVEFTSSSFLLPSCPINVEVCTGLQIPNIDVLSTKISGIVEDVVATRRRRRLEFEDILERSLATDELCQTKIANTDNYWNGGISIPIQIEELLRRGSNKGQQWSKIVRTIFRVSGGIFVDFEKQFSKGFVGGRFGLPSLNLNMGCDFGKFRSELSLGPLIQFNLGFVPFGPSHTFDARNGLVYGDDLDLPYTCKIQQLSPIKTQKCKDAIEAKKTAEILYSEQLKPVEDIHDVLCYLDFFHVTKDLWYNFLDASGIDYSDGDRILSGDFLMSDEDEMRDLLENFESDTGYLAVAIHLSEWTDDRLVALKKRMKDKYHHQMQRIRDDILQRIENTAECRKWDNEILSCSEWLRRDYKATYSRSTKDSCRHIFHPKYVHIPQTALGLFTNSLRDTRVSIGSYNKLYDTLLPISTYVRQTTSNFLYKKGSATFNPFAIISKLGLSKGYKSIGTLVAGIQNVGEWEPVTNETVSFWDVVRNSTSDFIDYASQALASGCRDQFVQKNLAYMFELVPNFKIGSLYDLAVLKKETVEEISDGGPKKFITSKYYEFCYALGLCPNPLIYRKVEPKRKEFLIDALLEANVPEFGKELVYSSRVVVEMNVSFASMTINLLEKEESRREITFKKKALFCEGRACFYEFESNPYRVFNPNKIKLNTTCD